MVTQNSCDCVLLDNVAYSSRVAHLKVRILCGNMQSGAYFLVNLYAGDKSGADCFLQE